jgi:hydrogenase maturation protease
VEGQNGTAAPKILVIGYGNTLRGDDAVGQRVAQVVSSWNRPGVTSIAVHQLTADLAEPLSKVDLVVFVDAKLARDEDSVAVQALEPSNATGSLGHTSDPRSLLALALAVFGRHPQAWLVSVPAVDFTLREGLSAVTSRAAEAAISQIAALIGPSEAALLHQSRPPVGYLG